MFHQANLSRLEAVAARPFLLKLKEVQVNQTFDPMFDLMFASRLVVDKGLFALLVAFPSVTAETEYFHVVLVLEVLNQHVGVRTNYEAQPNHFQAQLRFGPSFE